VLTELYSTLKPTIASCLEGSTILILDRTGDHAFNLVSEILDEYDPLSLEVVCPSLDLGDQHLLSFSTYNTFKHHLMDPYHFVRTAKHKNYDYIVDLTHIPLTLDAGRDSPECVNHILRNNLLIPREIDKKVLTGHYCKVVPLSETSTVYENVVADMQTALTSMLYIRADELNSDFAILIAMCALDSDSEWIGCLDGEITGGELYSDKDPWRLCGMLYRSMDSGRLANKGKLIREVALWRHKA